MKVPQSMVWEMPPRRELVYNLPAGGRVRNWLPEVTALSPVSDVHMEMKVTCLKSGLSRRDHGEKMKERGRELTTNIHARLKSSAS